MIIFKKSNYSKLRLWSFSDLSAKLSQHFTVYGHINMLVSATMCHLHTLLLESTGTLTEMYIMTLRYYGSYRSAGLAF